MHLDAMPLASREVFNYFASLPVLQPFILVGGTALAIQIQHRLSYDLDFAVFTPQLPLRSIQQWVGQLQQDGIAVTNITSPSAASQFRINTGEMLANYAQDYDVAGVKVTFFAQGRTPIQRQYYSQFDRVESQQRSFSILSVAGLKLAKTLVLGDRVRSRDLFDVMTLMQTQQLTLEQMHCWVCEVGHNTDFEHYLSVMTGDIPLDQDDEGLQPTGTAIAMPALYDYFNQKIDAWQIEQAKRLAEELSKPDEPNH